MIPKTEEERFEMRLVCSIVAMHALVSSNGRELFYRESPAERAINGGHSNASILAERAVAIADSVIQRIETT